MSPPSSTGRRLPSPVTFAPVAVEGGTGEAIPDSEDVALLRRTMSAQVGVIRERSGLRDGLATIANLERRGRSPRFQNMLATAKLVTAAALIRTESRGGHYRSDFPDADAAWQHRTFTTLAEAARIADVDRPLVTAE